MAEYGAKSLLADLAQTDVLMPVQMRSEGALAVV